MDAADALKKGKAIVFPTDTLYGLGVDATNKDAVKLLYKLKKRPKNKPVSIILSDIKMAKEYCKIDKKIEKILKKYLPGPYTFIIYAKENKFPENLLAGKRKVGIRIPDNKTCLNIVKKFGKPITATSANISGGKSPATADEIPKEIKENAFVVKGHCKYKKGSTIIDLIENRMIRKGVGEWPNFLYNK